MFLSGHPPKNPCPHFVIDLLFLRHYNICRVRRLQLLIATVGYTGYLPHAPGTFGSLISLLVIILLKPYDIQLLLIFPVIFIIGTISAGNVERILGKDSPHIVVDEFCGYLIAVAFLPKTFTYLVTVFVLFRFFDIVKPPPIKRMEKALKGGIGIMLDDLLAGVYANLCLQLWRILF